MRTINASEFEARCLQLLEEVAESGEPLVITKGGEPVYVLSPYPGRSATSWLRSMRPGTPSAPSVRSSRTAFECSPGSRSIRSDDRRGRSNLL